VIHPNELGFIQHLRAENCLAIFILIDFGINAEAEKLNVDEYISVIFKKFKSKK